MDLKLVRKATIEALQNNILTPGKKENLVERVMINEQITQVKGQDTSEVAEKANDIARRSISHAQLVQKRFSGRINVIDTQLKNKLKRIEYNEKKEKIQQTIELLRKRREEQKKA